MIILGDPTFPKDFRFFAQRARVAGSISNAITAALSPLVPENLNDGRIVYPVWKMAGAGLFFLLWVNSC